MDDKSTELLGVDESKDEPTPKEPVSEKPKSPFSQIIQRLWDASSTRNNGKAYRHDPRQVKRILEMENARSKLPSPQVFVAGEVIDTPTMTLTVLEVTGKDLILDYNSESDIGKGSIFIIKNREFRVRKVAGTILTLRPTHGRLVRT